MKKLAAIFLTVLMLFSLIACGNHEDSLVTITVPRCIYPDISEEEIKTSLTEGGVEHCVVKEDKVICGMTPEVHKNLLIALEELRKEVCNEAMDILYNLSYIETDSEPMGSHITFYLTTDEVTMSTYEEAASFLAWGFQQQIFDDPAVDYENILVSIDFVNGVTGETLIATVTSIEDMQEERYFGMEEPIFLQDDSYIDEDQMIEDFLTEQQAEQEFLEQVQFELTDEFIAQLDDKLQFADVSGMCGDDLFWYFIDNVLYITGSGPMYYSQYNTYMDKCAPLGVVIDEGVTTIAPYAFDSMDSIRQIRIPDTVTAIGEGAFINCTGLTSIKIPASVTRIEGNTFNNCTGLASIDLPEGLSEFGECAFGGTAITSFMIPDGCTRIEDQMFVSCDELRSIVIPDSVTSIGGYAFRGCESLEEIDLPDGLTELGTYALSRCRTLRSVSVPAGVSTIRNSVFEECGGLTSVTIPEGVSAIEGYAFSRCESLETIELPASLTVLEGNAFGDREEIGKLVVTYSCPNEVVRPAMDGNATCVWIKK